MKIKLSILLILISVLSFSQDKKTIKNFVESFVEYRIKENSFKKRDGQVLLVALTNSDECFKCENLHIQLDHTSFLFNIPYEKVFDVSGFKAIAYENEYSKNLMGFSKNFLLKISI